MKIKMFYSINQIEHLIQSEHLIVGEHHTHTHKANTNLSPFRNFRTSADYSSAV